MFFVTLRAFIIFSLQSADDNLMKGVSCMGESSHNKEEHQKHDTEEKMLVSYPGTFLYILFRCMMQSFLATPPRKEIVNVSFYYVAD